MKHLFFTIALTLLCFTASGQLLYKVTSPNGKIDSYIFGTHHMAPLSIINDIPEIQHALDNTESIVGEIDMTGGQLQMAMKLQQYAIAPSDSTLSSLYTPQQYAALDSAFTKLIDNPALSLKMLDGMRPMVVQALVTVSLMQKYLPEYNPEEQLDSYFQKEAKALGKEIIGLETVDQQGEILYKGMPIDRQAKALLKILENPQESIEEVKSVNQAYLSHDLQVLLDKTNDAETDEDSKNFMNLILNNRNHDWMTRLPDILSSRPTFVAVGALHLPGPDGILHLLENQGFSIQPIDSPIK